MVNFKDYAERFLEEAAVSLRLQSYSADSFRLYIVDNVSTEESRQAIARICPEAIIISREDGNYCAANNAGAAAAIADGAEYLIFANMDTVFSPTWLEELVICLESDRSIGIAQSKVFLYRGDMVGEERINSLGNLIHFLGFGFTRGNGHPASEYDRYLSEAGKYPDISYASGCSLMIGKALFVWIGGYDEQYYMYHDDVELSLKVKLAGYRVALAPKSVLWHKYEFSRSVGMLYYMERNRHIFFLSFYPLHIIFLLALPLLAMDLGVVIFSLKNGWTKGLMRAVGYFFRAKSWSHIIKRRRELRVLAGNRRKKIILSSLVGRLDFQEIDNPLLKIVNPLFDIYWKIIRKIA